MLVAVQAKDLVVAADVVIETNIKLMSVVRLGTMNLVVVDNSKIVGARRSDIRCRVRAEQLDRIWIKAARRQDVHQRFVCWRSKVRNASDVSLVKRITNEPAAGCYQSRDWICLA